MLCFFLLEGGSILKTYKRMFWVCAESLIITLTDITDLTCAEFISDNAVIALATTFPLLGILYPFILSISRASRIKIGHCVGNNDTYNEDSYFTSNIILGLLVSVLSIILFIFFGKFYFRLFAITEEQSNIAFEYLFIRLFGVLIFSISAAIINKSYAHLQNKKITILRTINLANIPLSIIFTYLFGVNGIALATVLTEVIELFILLLVFKPKFRKASIKYMLEILKLSKVYVVASVLYNSIDSLILVFLIKYLPNSDIVLIELSLKVYNIFGEMIGATEGVLDSELSQYVGNQDKSLEIKNWKTFRNCFYSFWLIHIPISIGFGLIYFNYISPVENIDKAMLVLLTYMASNVIWYIGLPYWGLLSAHEDRNIVVIVETICGLPLRLLFVYIALQLGFGIFSYGVSWLASCTCVPLTSYFRVKSKRYLAKE